MTTLTPIIFTTNALLPTWFRVGGSADRFARPANITDLRQCLEADPALRVLGDGANLLVDDDGVGNLVISLAPMNTVAWDARTNTLTVGAGVNLLKLIAQTARDGLGGLEVLAGIPASIGGALVMNAGGKYGQICDCVKRVFALDRSGREITLLRGEIDYSYRHSGLNHLIITGAELSLVPSDPVPLRERLKEITAYKKNSQPMADNSAGCCFKNPMLTQDLSDIGAKGARVSAGKLIDLAGCKGLRINSASVSERHGNFLTADTGGKARDVISLMGEVERRVLDRFGVALQREVVVWTR